MHGVFTALVTPFDQDLKIDLPAFRKLLWDQRAAGVTGVIPCGTTGEAPTLSFGEKKLLISAAISELKGSGLKIFAGTGSNDTADTLELSVWASKEGVDGLLLVTPYYNKPSQAGLEAHFKTIADQVDCEVMLYNVPARTGVSLTPETVSKLAAHPRIRSLKEATGGVAFTSEILDRLKVDGRSMDILSGDDATYLPMLCVGATGVVSVASNLFPRAMVALQNAVAAGKLTEARAIHQRYYPLFRDLFVDSNPVPIKAAMARAGIGGDRVRAPLAPLSATSRKTLEAALERCGVAAGATA